MVLTGGSYGQQRVSSFVEARSAQRGGWVCCFCKYLLVVVVAVGVGGVGGGGGVWWWCGERQNTNPANHRVPT